MNQAIDDELNQISFQDVDIYPHFSNCKTGEDAQATKHCFVETLHLQLIPFFENYELSSDSLTLNIQVDKNGMLLVTKITANKNEENSNLKTDLNQHLQEKLPTI